MFCRAAVVGDCQALDSEAASELVATNQDAPDFVTIEIEFFAFNFVAVYDKNGVAALADPLDRTRNVWQQLIELGGGKLTDSTGDRKDICLDIECGACRGRLRSGNLHCSTDP